MDYARPCLRRGGAGTPTFHLPPQHGSSAGQCRARLGRPDHSWLSHDAFLNFWKMQSPALWITCLGMSLPTPLCVRRLRGRDWLVYFSGIHPAWAQRVAGGIEFDITNEELANAANITPYTASRILSEWQRIGAIRKNRGKILVRSPERLFLHVA